MDDLNTQLTETIGLDVPIVQAPIGSATCPDLAAAVAETEDGTPVYRYEDSLAVPGMSGDVESTPLYAGQSAGTTDETEPAGELVATLREETVDALMDAP